MMNSMKNAISSSLQGQLASSRALRVERSVQNEKCIPLRRFGEVEDCPAYMTGQCISVCGGQVLTPS